MINMLIYAFSQVKRWAYCKICMTQTDQESLSRKEVWRCESCHHLIDHRGELVAD